MAPCSGMGPPSESLSHSRLRFRWGFGDWASTPPKLYRTVLWSFLVFFALNYLFFIAMAYLVSICLVEGVNVIEKTTDFGFFSEYQVILIFIANNCLSNLYLSHICIGKKLNE